MPKPKCSVDDCPTEAEKCGLCGKHYQRLRKTGTTGLPPRVRVPRDNFAFFWPNVDKNGPVPAHDPALGPCWIWTGGCNKGGYGVFYASGEDGRTRKTVAHRWLLGQVRGKPLTRDVVGEEDACHHCDNPPCVNPDHLYVGTRKQNVADAVARNRLWQQQVTHCPQGHPLDGFKAGRRYCKTCSRIGQRKHRTLDRIRCKNGHELAADNVILCRNGTRKCRICDAARLAKSHASRYGKAS